MSQGTLKIAGIALLCALAAIIIFIIAVVVGAGSDVKKGMRVLNGESVNY